MIGRDGIGCEPASATTVAGIRKLVQDGVIKEDETVVAVLTGHLLERYRLRDEVSRRLVNRA